MLEQTLGQALAEYFEHLKSKGKSERTIYTYGKDSDQIIETGMLEVEGLGSLLISSN